LKHYFTDNRELPSDRKEISFRFLGYDYRFVSDAGVFSKGEADEGSLLLVKTVLEEPLQSPLLDLGCGWGLMSLLLKHTRPQLQIVGTDINSPCHRMCARDIAEVEPTGHVSGRRRDIRAERPVSNRDPQPAHTSRQRRRVPSIPRKL
jgi:16S rRNA G1207 methylase RsmC